MRGQRQAQFKGHARHHVDRQQRVPAHFEEVIVQTDAFNLEHLLLAVNVVSRMALELGLTLTPQLLFQHPVLSDFVARLDTGGGAINEQKLSKLEALLDDMEEV